MISSSTSPIELKVLINGRDATEYSKDGQHFIEGRQGSKFTIKLTNKTYSRVHAVVSVDGLSINTGNPASQSDSGYILNPLQTIEIPGWTLSSSEVAAFQFSTKNRSYAQQGGGSSINCGVIGVAVWSEKQKPIITKGIMRGFGDSMWAMGSTTSISDANLSAQSSINNLGTEFGSRTDFATTSVNFENDRLLDTLVLYYDDIKGLKSRGIEVKSPAKNQQVVPNPFPGGCVPPTNWRG